MPKRSSGSKRLDAWRIVARGVFVAIRLVPDQGSGNHMTHGCVNFSDDFGT